MRKLPELVCKLCYGFDAWVIGSAANPDTDLTKVRDFDVIVPYNNYKSALMLLPKEVKLNTFGGFKVISEEKEVDFWPDDLTNLLLYKDLKYVWHPKSGKRWISL